jgi:hypothetical protein
MQMVLGNITIKLSSDRKTRLPAIAGR